MSTNIYTQRICQYCGKEFTARTTVTKYCSLKCNSRDYKKNLRESNIDKSEKETINTKLQPLIYVQNKEILSLKEAAMLLGISRTTLYRMRKKNQLVFKRIGTKLFIRQNAIVER